MPIPGLDCKNVTFTYPGASAPTLNDVDLSLQSGKMVTLLGANASGKSTLCLLLCGLLLPDSGTVTLDGVPPEQWQFSDVQLVQQSADDQIVAPTVYDDVAFGPRNQGLDEFSVAERTVHALQAVGLAGHQHARVRTLSGGERQRLALAGVLAVRPRFLLLDETTAHLDAPSAARLTTLLRRLADAGIGILLVTHRAEDSWCSDRVLVLDQGRIVCDASPREVLYQHEALVSWGVAAPPLSTLINALRLRGVTLPSALTIDELLQAL